MILIYNQIDPPSERGETIAYGQYTDTFNVSIGLQWDNYIITTLHTCKNSQKIYIHHENKKYIGNIYMEIYEINIVILKSELISTCSFDINYNTLNIFFDRILTYDTESELNKNIKIIEGNVSLENINSILFPSIPVYNIKMDDIHDILPGSLIINNNTINGIIMKQNNIDNTLIVLPCVIIKMFIDYRYNNDHLKGIILRACYCDLLENNMHVVGQYITENTCYYKIKNKKKYFSFKEGDVIISINNNNFDDNMFSSYDKLDVKLPLNTLLMLISLSDKSINIKYLRKNKIYDICLKGTSYNNIFKINIYNPTIIYWNNFIFSELTESECDDQYHKYSINDKYIILKGWETSLSEKQLNYFSEDNAIIDNNILRSLYIINKINNKTIKCIDDIKSINLKNINYISFKNISKVLYI